ncbi:MAG: hypothetical protein ACE5D6_01795 [Candidatus Zixiibacteriota bacterium]
MNTSFGRIKAQLAEPVEDRIKELVNSINKNINPPEMITESDIYIRAMYIVSDEVNSFGGRFPSDELEKLVDLLVDSPVLVGHRKDKLPIGRNFHAAIVKRDGKNWVKSYFYWLRSAEGADYLKENIDGGIYKECSIGFTFLFPECSICLKDIRNCQHVPLKEYRVAHARKTCYFNYRQLERVLETSLVYRGAVPDTFVSKELDFAKDTVKQKDYSLRKINNLTELEDNKKYFITPYYEALEVLVNCKNSELTLTELDGSRIEDNVVRQLFEKGFPEVTAVYGQLVGYRGKERCSMSQLRKYIDKQKGQVSRLELKLFPNKCSDSIIIAPASMNDKVKMIRHQITNVTNLDNYARRLMTKKGVRLWLEDQLPPNYAGYHYIPDTDNRNFHKSFCLVMFKGNCDALLNLNDNGSDEKYIIRQFSLTRLMKGSRFVSDRITDNCSDINIDKETKIKGELKEFENKDDGLLLKFEGGIKGKFVLQPFKINGINRYLFYQPAVSM